MIFFEIIKLAFRSVSVNKLRAALTLLSIAIGVFAIMGAGSLVDSVNYSVEKELDEMGSNSFIITKAPSIQMGDDWRKYRRRKPINYSQYEDLKERMTLATMVSAHSASGGKTIEAGKLSTDPDVSLVGADEHYMKLNSLSIEKGRGLTPQDIDYKRKVAVLGADVIVKIFPNVDPIGKKIRINNQTFTVVGTLKARGAVLGRSQDNLVLLPLSNFLKYYAEFWEESLVLIIKSYDEESLTATVDEAIGHMRAIRNVKPWQDNTFEITTNEALRDQFASFTGFLTYFGFFSGFIALIAAGVGIMNIMLVTVKERTREIGVRKAVGAKRIWVLTQFLVETIALCWLGGIIGITLGFLGAGALSGSIGMDVVVSWTWISVSIGICTALGLAAGLYPAWKAANLDPIDALRYE